MLLSLPLALAAVWWVAARQEPGGRPALPFPALAAWSAAASLRSRLAQWLPLAVRLAALALLGVGLARPQKVTSQLSGPGQGIDIMMALDTSLSMNAVDFQPSNRLEAAKDTAIRFVQGRIEDRIGLVVFGGAPMLACPLTLDYDALTQRIQGLGAGMTGVDGTALGEGIISGINHLKAGSATTRILILLTDGRGNVGLDAITAAKTAAALGVKIYAIGTAKRGESVMPVDDPNYGRVMVRVDEDLDEDTLLEIARLTNGKYWRATNLSELRAVYAEIDRLEKSAVKRPEIVSRADLYHAPALAAALLLLFEIGLAQGLLLRWP
ncbi:MAG TPA: aerotolerance regulator BatA [Elusimicrobia bacterium]|nr:aerotolerance regulator BatA [Elusimicrobiota bacterium]HBT60814.1 aerotolerance regulator BatA [Elusimicrobiota bacterium]